MRAGLKQMKNGQKQTETDKSTYALTRNGQRGSTSGRTLVPVDISIAATAMLTDKARTHARAQPIDDPHACAHAAAYWLVPAECYISRHHAHHAGCCFKLLMQDIQICLLKPDRDVGCCHHATAIDRNVRFHKAGISRCNLTIQGRVLRLLQGQSKVSDMASFNSNAVSHHVICRGARHRRRRSLSQDSTALLADPLCHTYV